jgi:hypothetical protein
MRSLFTLAALGGLVLGGRHFLIFLNEHRKNALTEKKLEVWEGEGGGVPVTPARTAAQISPRKSSRASPRGVR